MAMQNFGGGSLGMVRESFLVTVDVDETASMGDPLFVCLDRDRQRILRRVWQQPARVFFECQELGQPRL